MISEIFTVTNLKFLFDGLKITIFMALATIIISCIFGTILGGIRNYNKGILEKLAAVYIEIFRNTPLLLWILAIRFLVPIKPLASGVLSLSLFTTAIVAEIVRGGLRSVKIGQMEAGLSQGFSKFQVLIYIILPQGFKNMVPALLSQVTTIIKDTAFLWVVGIEDFTGKGMILMGQFRTSAEVFTMFGFLAATYFMINFLISYIVRRKQRAKISYSL